ncbi:sacsin-like [Babylonia areolata]|uniref:sacsin-like n=1 Tax=Babylonia areolata TaxID=304850 RepID=UPI003FD380C1
MWKGRVVSVVVFIGCVWVTGGLKCLQCLDYAAGGPCVHDTKTLVAASQGVFENGSRSYYKECPDGSLGASQNFCVIEAFYQVVFVKDFRQHSTERLLSKGWEEVYGPALCVFNDACFSTNDMAGIQALGEGSKEGDSLKTGKYGVGFNAVYNLTDTPCFLTTVVPPDDNVQVNSKQLGEKMCVLDPNFFVVSRRSRLPGQLLLVNARFKEQYQNMLDPFDLAGVREGKRGTMFRLPLRTQDRASVHATSTEHQAQEQTGPRMKSQIKQPAVSMAEVGELLHRFQQVMGECLLFLSHVKKVSVYTAHQDGQIELDYETHISVDDSGSQKLQEFYGHVRDESKKLKSGAGSPGLLDFSARGAAVRCRLSDSDGKQEDWLVVHKFGLTDHSRVPPCLQSAQAVQKYRLLPLGGVALCLSALPHPARHSLRYRTRSNTARFNSQIGSNRENQAGTWEGDSTGTSSQDEDDSSPSTKSQQRTFHAFCMLPLPVATGLPVHVNARFALDHETRSNLYLRAGEDQSTWNKLLISDVITLAYITALCEITLLCFAQEGECLHTASNIPEPGTHQKKRRCWRKESAQRDDKSKDKEGLSLVSSADLSWKLDHYASFFPQHQAGVDAFWNGLVTSFYQQLAEVEAQVFPSVREDLNRLVWVPAKRSQGFPGFFWNLDNPKLMGVLKKLNMNIIECPFRIHDSFVNSKVDTVRQVQIETVIEFLLSCHRSEADACFLNDLPQMVEDTPFKTVDNVVEVVRFIHNGKRTSDLGSLPLNLRMSGKLHCFSSGTPALVSKFYDLLPDSAERFLHEKLISFFPAKLPDFVQSMDIKTFVDLLPATLAQETFGCGGILPLNQLPFTQLRLLERWISRVWEFLTCELGKPSAGMLDRLYEWSLIPSVKDQEVVLFPVGRKDDVVHILKEIVGSHPMTGTRRTMDEFGCELSKEELCVNKCLDKMSGTHLNKLNTAVLPAHCVAAQIVASVRNPEGLLQALTHTDVRPQTLMPGEAESILDFFFTKLGSSSELRFLPFFERPDGTLTSLGNGTKVVCLPQDVPHAGLNEWSGKQQISLVKTNRRLQRLYERLCVNMPTQSAFYSSYLLHTIADLPREAIRQHMEYIRQCLQPHHLELLETYDLLNSLQKTQFITGQDGTLCKASDFYDPDCEVFKVMLTEDHFPPGPYKSSDWKVFLRKIGMICAVSEEMFLRFARKVEGAAGNSLSEEAKRQSVELSRHLNRSKKLRQEQFLRQLKDIRFILPQSQLQLEEACGKALGSVHPMFRPSTPLVSFSEGLSTDSVHLVWTTSCLFSRDADPTKFCHWTDPMNDWIGFKAQPSKDLVTKHVKNVCQTLDVKRQDGSSHLTTFPDDVLDDVEEIMESLYGHLTKFDDEDLEVLHGVPVIMDRENKSMYSGQQVIVTILEEEIIEGHVVKAPLTFGKFFPLFQRLGASERVSIGHYARALEQIHLAYQEKPLNPNDLILVSKAVDNLFKVLECDEEKNLTRPVHLPAVNILCLKERFPQVMLVDSKNILCQVRDKQQRRIKTPVRNLLVFVGFAKLDLKNHDIWKANNLLPEPFRMKEWNEVVKETLTESCRTLAEENHRLTSQLHSELCAHAVKRIIHHFHRRKTFTEDALKIEDGLKRMKIMKVTGLQTFLEMDGSQLPGTEEDKHFFVEKDCDNVSIFIRSDENITTLGDRQLAYFIRMAVTWAVGFAVDEALLSACLENLSNAEECLDNRDIMPYQIQQQTTVFPPPGSFVPEEMQCLLDQDVYEYKVSEYVAFELYDPSLEPQSTESQNDGREAGDASAEADQEERADDRSSGRHGVRKPIYIIAKIEKVLPHPSGEHEDARTRLMFFRYIIDVGEEQPKEVQAIELYKFIRPSASHTVLVPFSGETTQPPSAFAQPDQGDDLKKVLADIRHQLREIWHNFHDEKSRLRAVKRLLLKWHPDKNPGREEFCTKVFQQMQRYLTLLKQGRQLPSDDEDDVEGYGTSGTNYYEPYYERRSSSRRRRCYRGPYDSFFDDIFSRGESYARSRTSFGNSSRSGGSGGGSGGGGMGGWGSASFRFFSSSPSYPTPQPEEGRRWMRQAVQDLTAARLTLRQGGRGLYNWACYQAHQCAEKALKAVLFRRDASHAMKTSHDICSLAARVGDAQIQADGTQLHDVVQYHTRMRYPDLIFFPKIPSDVYGESDAQRACDLAEKITDKAQELFDTYKTPPRQPSPPPPPRQPSPPQQASLPCRPSTSHRSVEGGGSSRQRLTTPKRKMAVAGESSPKFPRRDPSIKALPPPP